FDYPNSLFDPSNSLFDHSNSLFDPSNSLPDTPASLARASTKAGDITGGQDSPGIYRDHGRASRETSIDPVT
ncbi:MAG: hypothetical protein LBD64_01375, partial [Odoribacteraceae bacterium]|nr:hypothetical protein [Odoribacteraceae bacterium]